MMIQRVGFPRFLTFPTMDVGIMWEKIYLPLALSKQPGKFQIALESGLAVSLPVPKCP